MKLKFFLLYILIISVFCATNIVFAQSSSGFVVEGERFDGLTIGKSTMDDVISIYGTDYRLVKHEKYSLQMIYKNLGLSFYTCQDDPNKEIFVVIMQSPFKATTAKGIVLGESTFADVLRLYGKWTETSVGFEYEGIYFQYTQDNFEEEIKENDLDKTSKAEITSSTLNLNDTDLTVSGRKVEFTIDGTDVSDNEIDSENDEEELENNEYEISKIKTKIVRQIELIEKSGIRQCHGKFRK